MVENLVEKIRALQESSKALESLGPDTEGEFLAIGDTLNRLASLCYAMTDDASSLAAKAGFQEGSSGGSSGFIEESRSIFHEVTRHVEDSMASLGAGEHLFKDLQIRVGKLLNPARQLAGLGKRFRVMGIAIKVESSRTESATKGFLILAEEVAAISVSVLENSRSFQEKAVEARKNIGASLDNLLRGSTRKPLNTEGAVLEILTTLEGIGNRSEQLAASLQERSASLVQGIGEVVMAMQFHDITRQQLENVASSIRDCVEKTRTIRKDDQGGAEEICLQIYGILSIQAAHLNNIYQQIMLARKQIGTGLTRIMEQAVRQAEDANKLLTMDNAVGGKSVVGGLEREIDNIVSDLNSSSGVISNSAEMSRQVFEDVSEIGGFINDIEKLAFDVKLLAINAMIEATKTGDTGRPLAVLAKELGVLSLQTREYATEAISLLETVTEGTRKQLDFTHSLEQQRQEVDSMVLRARSLSATILSSMQGMAEKAKKMDDDSRSMESRINRLIPGVRFPVIMGDRISNHWGAIVNVLDAIELAYPHFLERSAEMAKAADEHTAQYVMARERDIHRQFTAIQNKSGGGAASAPSEADDEGIELFDDNDTGQASVEGETEEEYLDDNVELF